MSLLGLWYDNVTLRELWLIPWSDSSVYMGGDCIHYDSFSMGRAFTTSRLGEVRNCCSYHVVVGSFAENKKDGTGLATAR